MVERVHFPPWARVALLVALAVALALLGAKPTYAAPGIALTPATVQPNQAVSVTGTGFSTGSGNTVASITLGGALVPADKINTANPVQLDNAGNFVAIVVVPVTSATLAAGGLTLLVTDSKGVQASATLTVPAPALSVSPATSRAGTAVTVTGTSFHVSSARAGADYAPPVNLYYYNNSGVLTKLVATVTPDSAGKFVAAITVPVNAAVGLKNSIKAFTVGGPVAGVSADHTVPAPVVAVSPAAGAPETVATVTGVDLPAYTQVRDLAFAHVSQLSATPVFTDASGAVTLTVKVPLLENGAYPVRLQVGDSSYISAFTIQGSWYTAPAAPTPPPPSISPAEGLAPLQGNLIRTWNQDNASKSWAFYDPDPAFTSLGSLTKLVDGLVYWVRVKADQTVRLNGKERALFQGWNLIPW